MFGMLFGAGLVVAGAAVMVCHHRGRHHVLMNCALRRLKATEAQKQQLKSLFENAHGRLRVTQERVFALRAELADLMAAPDLETHRLEKLEAQLFETLGEGAQVVRELVTKTHETLGPAQRQQVAEWIRHIHRHHHCHSARCHC